MEGKLCPLKFMGLIKGICKKEAEKYLCDKKFCEWWVDGKYQHETGCALAVLARILTVINRMGGEK